MTDIVIPTFNQSFLTLRCLESVLENTDDYRIVWVDNGSRESEIEAVRDFLLDNNMPAHFIGLERNTGFTYAVNRGIEESVSEFVVLLNNDVVVTKDWMKKLLWGMESVPKLGVLGVVTDNISSVAKDVFMVKKLGLIPPVDWNSRKNEVVLFSVTGRQHIASATTNVSYFCTMLRKKMILQVGLLDEDNYPMLGSDNEYNARVRNCGWQVGVLGNCFVHHTHKGTRRILGI